MRLAALLVALAGCMEMGAPEPWFDVAELEGAEVMMPPARTLAAPARLRIVTFNVEKGSDPEALAAALRANPALAAADVVLVQELEAYSHEGASRAARLAAALGMGFVYAPERIEGQGTHGPAILSPWPLERVQVMRLPRADLAWSQAPRLALAADVHAGDTVLRVIDLHLDTRLTATQRILQIRPAVLDAPEPTVVGGDLNTLPYGWLYDGSVPLGVPTDAIVDANQAPVIDDYMRHIDYSTPTAGLGATQRFGVIESRLDSLYVRGLEAVPGAVERGVGLSDHWPVWIDVIR